MSHIVKVTGDFDVFENVEAWLKCYDLFVNNIHPVSLARADMLVLTMTFEDPTVATLFKLTFG